jgi:ATPase family associated with various cellular activities (AAA)/AAA lid domain
MATNPTDLVPLVDEFRNALDDCQVLYASAAQDCVLAHLLPAGESEGDFLERMIDLSHGLMMRIFVEVAYADENWAPESLVLAAELFEHIWARRLKRRQLREALDRFRLQDGVGWEAVLSPFARLAPFRHRTHQLQTVVLRLANLVVKANGRLTPEEVARLRGVQAELRRVLDPVPLAGGDKEDVLGPVREVSPDGQHRRVVQQMPASRDRAPSASTHERPAVRVDNRPPEERLEESLAELDALIGLEAIKQEVRGLINLLKLQKAREQFELPHTQVTLHSVFSGNPGTGKTTVARLLGRIFNALGLLASGHLIETDRSGLVAEYAGQTAPRTHKKIDEALDGVLFIDEAYSLFAEHGDDPYGAEALQVLLKRMEDDRNRLVIILAGYPRPLERLLRSNPGLSSRFSRQFQFPDYSAPELGRIFESLCRQNRYVLPAATRGRLLAGFSYLLGHRDEHFGNGRLARNVFERAVSRLANRITDIVPLTRELLTTLEPDDIEMEGVPAAVWDKLAAAGTMVHIPCPGCRQTSRLPLDHLGQRVECPRCRHHFVADWGELV